MTDRKEHFDEDLEGRREAGTEVKVPPKLAADLNALFEPPLTVPPEVDRAVMDRASQHFVRRQSIKGGRRRLRWAGTAAAAAAVIIFALVFDFTKQSSPTISQLDHPVARADIDRSGRVDILDALKLARHIESASRAETSLSLRKQGWDINGDGLVNRSDVDLVAYAAVRLDKGVL